MISATPAETLARHTPAQRRVEACAIALLAALAQRLRLVPAPEHHRVHHAHPFDTHYCTASGWLNAPLDALGVFRSLERAIGACSRAAPRRDAPGT